ncbi:hypothetical protein K7711_40175 [Nocardia sp. CA2R105]|uniref:hypothetical protein n=1 Tax=Nocardia coffeae TaxID=2873381 RepID=UPI001CA7610B|nr:hypothetical protein [Nocardia coffeae]MBY8862742.1 hypothetical protein [Nocardia coffeae]
MDAEHDSPYWNAIVGENWPAISPGDWGNLEMAARNGAAALDPAEAERARRAFDDAVPSSVGLQPVKDHMLAQKNTLDRFVDALVAAADTFRDISDIVYRTRHRIHDIVEQATGDIREVIAESSGDEKADPETERERISAIIRNARDEVARVMAGALNSVGPQGLPELQVLAGLLGQRDPWATAHPRYSGGSDTGAGPRGSGAGHRFDNGTDRFRIPPNGLPSSVPALQELQRFLGRFGLQAPVSILPGQAGQQPDVTADGPAQANPTEAPPATSAPAYGDGGVPAESFAPPPVSAGTGQSFGGSDAPPIADSGDTYTNTAAPESVSESPGDPGGYHTDDAAPVGTTRSDAVSSGPHEGTETSPDETSVVAAGPMGLGVIGAVSQASLGSSTVVSSTSVAASPTTAGHASAGTPDTQGSASTRAAGAPRISATPSGPPPVATTPGAASGGPVQGAAPSGVTAAQAKGQAPARHGSQAAADSETDKDTGDSTDDQGSNHIVRDAVGAAMLAAAAPTFILGERVDGDLVLARSLLSSLLTVTESVTMGLDCAVSLMRHPGGVAAFVTTTEGRGWLPAGVFLPREVSTPWVWSAADGSAWEGISDPARVLAEFALAWGAKTGARLSALVSSQPIDGELHRQLSGVPVQGSVSAAPTMDFSCPAPGLADRLELVGAPHLLERVSAVPTEGIAGRCLELAVDAHLRVARSGSGAASSLGTAALRERILQASRQGRAVPDEWWAELRDADDLTTASMLSLRADVSRVPLGELRSESVDGQSASALCAMLFERRCDELVLLSAAEPSRQLLRDVVYAHGQLLDHPRFASIPATAQEAVVRRRPTITAGPER